MQPPHLQSLAFYFQSSFNVFLMLYSLILTVSCMSMGVNSLAAITDNNSNDRQALVDFKNQITEDPFGVLSSWNDKNNSFHFCEWRGVTCSHHHGRVTKIDLHSQGLVGFISPYIGNLSFLEDISLGNNSLTGGIPQQISRLFRLKYLSLSNNSLEGEIPYNISGCSNLIHLNISRNNLVGSIPSGLDYLSNLKMMFLGYNNLSGDIPTSLGNLSSLTHLSLLYNNLEGRIPDTLSQLTSLKLLVLSLNRLTGIFPPSLYNISSLESLSMAFNRLHGSIPIDIGKTLPDLIFFSVVGNHLTGTIPISFSNMSRLVTLQLGENNLVGSVPNNLGNLRNLERLRLGDNKLGSRQANDLNFLNSLVNCTNLMDLTISKNNFGGLLPNSIANLTVKLVYLDFGENQISGSIPPGIQNLQGLTKLLLGSNQFTGSIPPGIGLLQNLGILGFDNNKLVGSIPSSFGNLTRLIILYMNDNNFTGVIPPNVGNCNSLQILDLHSNKLSGNIPKQVLLLPSLSVSLDLGYNSFTGSLPVEVGHLKDIGFLALSGNKLSGAIPSTIGECLSLRNLYLDGNFFQGNIPSTITSLKGLESLRLSHNNLSGIIPKGLENLSTLITLDLSYNNLEGAVPTDGVFKNASKFSVQGNNKLCGGIPVLKLQICSVALNPNMKQKHKVIIIIIIVVWFLTLVVISAVLYWRKHSKAKLPSTVLDMGKWFKSVSYSELLKATNGFNSSTNLLGVGNFGSVYKGIVREDGSKSVAVKVLQLQQKGARQSFMAECNALRKVRHKNLLKIVTCCSSVDFHGYEFKALVFEYMANGSLEKWLHPYEDDTRNVDELHVKNMNLEIRLNVAVDVAYALSYLHHDCESPIVHCDLKPSNVLLDDDLIAHVGDFGLAKILHHDCSISRQLNEHDASSTAIKGSIGYVSPEYGLGGEVSTQGDVYSYGILLLEMFTGKSPTDDMFKDGLNIHSFCKMHAMPERVLDIVDLRMLDGENHDDSETNNYHTPRSERINRARHKRREILSSIIQIGVVCSSEIPSDRISMNEVIVDVQAVKNRFLRMGIQ